MILERERILNLFIYRGISILNAINFVGRQCESAKMVNNISIFQSVPKLILKY